MTSPDNEPNSHQPVSEIETAAAALPPDEGVIGLASSNPILLAKLLRLQGVTEVSDDIAARRIQAEQVLAQAVDKLEAGSQAEDDVRYWLSPSVAPPMLGSFDDSARATVLQLANDSPLLASFLELLPRRRIVASPLIENVETGDYL